MDRSEAAEQLRSAIAKAGVSRETIAGRCRRSRQNVDQFMNAERGDRTLVRIEALAAAVGCRLVVQPVPPAVPPPEA